VAGGGALMNASAIVDGYSDVIRVMIDSRV